MSADTLRARAASLLNGAAPPLPISVENIRGPRGNLILSGTSIPASDLGQNGDYYIRDLSASGQGRRMYGPKTSNAWPAQSWRIEVPGKRVSVTNADYQILQEETQVGLTSLTASRTVYLPDSDIFPEGYDLVISDESGSCSELITITIRPGIGTNDTIGGPDGSSIVILSSPYQSVRFRRGSANLWIRS